MGGLRLAFRVAWMVGLLILCVPLHYLWKLFGARSPWPRLFLGFVGRRFGLRVRTEGRPLTENVLYTPNHVSWLDILAVGGAVPAVFVTKAELEGIVRAIHVGNAEPVEYGQLLFELEPVNGRPLDAV